MSENEWHKNDTSFRDGTRVPTDLFFNNRNSRFRPASSPWRPSPPAIIIPGGNDIIDDEFNWWTINIQQLNNRLMSKSQIPILQKPQSF